MLLIMFPYRSGLKDVNGSKLDRMKHAMDLAIAERIRMYDIDGPNNENAGVWLDVGDVIREMIMSCVGKPGEEYNIVLSGDGRSVPLPNVFFNSSERSQECPKFAYVPQ